MLASRLKAATIGFGTTVAPLAVIAAIQFAIVPQIGGADESLGSGERAEYIANLRREWFIFHAVAATLVGIYWLLTAVLGRGQLLRFRVANVSLALFVLLIIASTPFFALIPWPDNLRGLCPFLGISEEYWNPYAFDDRSSCGLFVDRVHGIMLLALIGLPIPLLVTSLIVRIVGSRRAISPDE